MTLLTNTRDLDNLWPNWSPDHHQIAFVRGSNEYPRGTPTRYRVFVMNADGSDVRQLTFDDDFPDGGDHGRPEFHPDGERIAFDHAGDIYEVLLDPRHGEPRIGALMADGETYDGSPEWDPTGTKLAFERRAPDAGRTDIHVAHFETVTSTSPTSISGPLVPSATHSILGVWDSSPNWDDGARILCLSYAEGEPATIWAINADGTDLAPVWEESESPTPSGYDYFLLLEDPDEDTLANWPGPIPVSTWLTRDDFQPDW